MHRREMIGAAMAGAAALVAKKDAAARETLAKASRGMPSPRIKDIRVISTMPQGTRLSVVKIITDQDGLHGYGCASFWFRADLIGPAVENYLKPLLLGRAADRIEDIWQLCYDSSYWKNGPVLNNAISGIDQALWDIKGRQAGMPVYQLLGGKAREAADAYRGVGGKTIPETVENAKKLMAQGFRHVRVQTDPDLVYGATHGGPGVLHDKAVFNRGDYIRRTLALLEACRKELGGEVELIHDVHERISVPQAVQFTKDVEQFRMFYLEDPLSPEDIAWYRNIRQQSSTPISMGELFNSPHEWTPMITERLIDFMRMHVSQTGGLTPCRKVAAMGEIFNVRTAWHGPADVSPVGHAANLALALSCTNFGVQEWSGFNDASLEIFRGAPELRNGYLYANEAPGWGIEVDEAAALRHPYDRTDPLNGGWPGGEVRLPDGQVSKF
ncbi:MAG TPA: enolase C-terminal domain-like protein [Rhizomicrobium sp.]|nr:enolase C-terminal domain-like protein [Rhizomicrobium sp.]